MSIFKDLTNYGGTKWELEATKGITKADKAEVESAEVVASTYGLSMCFAMKAGGMKFVPLSRDSQLAEGDEVDINSVQFLELSREGDNNILRADGEAL